MKLPFRRAAALVTAVCLSAWLAACSGGGAVGKGNAPKYLIITASSSSRTQVQSLRVHECVPQSIYSFMYFDDGSSGNVTGRVTWSSSDPGTVAVSNGTYRIPGTNAFYPRGTLIPLKTGQAQIAATFSTLRIIITVNVGQLTNPQLKEVVEGINIAPPGNSFRMGIATTQDLHLTADLDQVETDLSAYADWGFQNPNNSVATIALAANSAALGGNVGRITGVGTGGPLVAQATLPLCPLLQTSMNVSVLPIQQLSIQPQFAGNPPLIVGNGERMMVFADFGNGPEQDISTQATMSSTNIGVMAFGTTTGLLGTQTIAYFMRAVGPGGAVIGASFTKGGINLQAPTVQTSAIQGNLLGIQLTGAAPFSALPGVGLCNGATAAIPTPQTSTAGSLTPVQFCALGVYGGDYVQDITPEVTWTDTAATVGTVGTTQINSGLFTSDTSVSGSLFVTATAPTTSSTVIVNTATAAINVNPHPNQ